MSDDHRILINPPPDAEPWLVNTLRQLSGALEELSQGQVTKTSDISSNETDVATNTTNIATNTSGLSTHIADITTVHGKPNDKYDATSAPGVTNDVDEGYTPGSKWVDVTNDKEYTCLDNSDGAAVWTETTQSGGSGASFDSDVSVRLSGNQTIAAGVAEILEFDTEDRDVNTEFNTTTHTWTCKTAGTYHVVCAIRVAAYTRAYLALKLNGGATPYAYSTNSMASDYAPFMLVSRYFDLSVNDYITAHVEADVNTTVTAGVYTYFQVIGKFR